MSAIEITARATYRSHGGRRLYVTSVNEHTVVYASMSGEIYSEEPEVICESPRAVFEAIVAERLRW